MIEEKLWASNRDRLKTGHIEMVASVPSDTLILEAVTAVCGLPSGARRDALIDVVVQCACRAANPFVAGARHG